MTRPERRRVPRYAFQVDVEVQWGSEVLSGLMTDVSLIGMFIALNSPLWVGANFTARLLLGEPLDLNCTVRRVLPGKGMGVFFVDLTDETRAWLADLIKKISD